MTQIKRFEDLENIVAVKAVIAAWTVEGPVPSYHNKVKAEFCNKWPSLAVAVERLVKTYSVPILTYQLYVDWDFPVGTYGEDQSLLVLDYNTWKEVIEAQSRLMVNTQVRKQGTLTIRDMSIRVTHTGRYEEKHNGR